MAYDEAKLREDLKRRGLLSGGVVRLKRRPDGDDDPGNDRFDAYVVDSTNTARRDNLDRNEASFLQYEAPDAVNVVGDEEDVVPREEDLPTPKAQALKKLAAQDMEDLERTNNNFQVALGIAGRLGEKKRAEQATWDAPRAPKTLTKLRPQSRPSPRPALDYTKSGNVDRLRGFQPLAGDAPPVMQEEVEGVAVVPSSGTKPGAPRSTSEPYDAEYAEALRRQRSRELDAILGRAGDEIATAISGVGSVDNDYWDSLRGMADSPVKDLLAQREANRKKGLSDPNSPQSKRLQNSIAKALPGVYTPEELAGITAADEDVVLKYGEMRARLDERKAMQAMQAQQRQEDLAREDRRTAEQRAWEAQQAGASRTFQAGENAKNRAAQRELAGLNNAADLEQARLRGMFGPDGQPLAGKGTIIPGLEVVPGAAPTPADATIVKKSEAARRRMTQFASELKALHEKYGTELVGANARRMEQLSTAMQLEAKTIAELGALTGDDLRLMTSVTGADPSSLTSNLKSLVGLDGTQQALEGVQQWTDGMANATRETYGYRPAPGAQAPRGPNVPRVPAGQVLMLGKDGKQYTVDEAEAAEAEANGWRKI